MKIDLTLDSHAHILPRCDHGSDGVDTSLRQLAMAGEAGVRTVCATPHFYPQKESVECFLARRQRSWEQLWPHLTGEEPKIELGAEVLICDGIEHMEGLPRLCRSGTRELLLEMPFYRWPQSIWDTLYRLLERRVVQIVLAHADRYPPEDIQQLIREGVPLQLNAECLTRIWSRGRYIRWIEQDAVCFLGSDIHMLGSGYRDWKVCRKLLNRKIG